jgi:hypothetical protein
VNLEKYFSLSSCIEDDDYDEVERCIANGIDLHIYNEWALRKCAFMRRAEIAKLLLKNGACYEAAVENLFEQEQYYAIAFLAKIVCPEESER